MPQTLNGDDQRGTALRARYIVLGLVVPMAAAASSGGSEEPLPRQVRALFAMTPDQIAASPEGKDAHGGR